MCGHVGVSITFILLQSLYVLLIVWFVDFCYKYVWHMIVQIDNLVISALAIFITLFVMLVDLIILFPETIKVYAVITNVKYFV